MLALSEHFDYAEFTPKVFPLEWSSDDSNAFITETITLGLHTRIFSRLISPVLEPMRDALGNYQIQITSGIRTIFGNQLCGGVDDSHHLFQNGRSACDIVVCGVSKIANYSLTHDAFLWLRDNPPVFWKTYLKKPNDKGGNFYIHISGIPDGELPANFCPGISWEVESSNAGGRA